MIDVVSANAIGWITSTVAVIFIGIVVLVGRHLAEIVCLLTVMHRPLARPRSAERHRQSMLFSRTNTYGSAQRAFR